MKQLAALWFLCITSIFSHAQTGFSRDTNIPVNGPGGPLTMPWAGGLNYPVFSEIDLDGNGSLDLFAFDKNNNHVVTFVNSGGTGLDCWRYAPEYADQFPFLRSWAFLYDYNCDGKPDIFTCSYRNNGIAQYRNDSQGSNLLFTLVDSAMQYNYNGTQLTNIGASTYLVPTFNDIDNDGDMDIVGLQLQCVGGFAYYKNLSMEHTGHCDSINDYVIEHNVWGEFALRSGLFNNVAVGSWNVNCFLYSPAAAPEDPSYSYSVAQRDDTYASIFTLDIDNDGDKDALIGDSGAENTLLVVNGGDSSHAVMVSQDTLFPSYNVPVHEHTFSLHAYADCDNDGVKDLLVSPSEWQNYRGIQFYKNTGTNSLPTFQYGTNDFLQRQMIDVGECAAAVLYDIDADGKKDLIIGNKYRATSDTTSETSIAVYRNTGTNTSPSFEWVTDDFGGINSMHLTGQLFPAFGDVDGDNDPDMLLGLDNGSIAYFENTAGPGNPVSFAPPVFNYAGIDVGQACAPQLVDLNRDGYLDLVIGQKNGLIRYFENSQSFSNPFSSTPTKDTLGGIILQYIQSTDGFIVPFVFDQNGDYRLVATYMEGNVYLYGNIDGNILGNYTLLDTILEYKEGTRYGYNLTVSGADLNGDTLTDLVFGLYSGGVQIFYQDNLANSVSGVDAEKSVSVYPVPASDRLIVRSKEMSGRVTLYDVSGREIIKSTLSSGYAIVDVSTIAKGSYFVRIESPALVTTKKIVISR